MRVVISQLLAIVRRYPTLVDGAFVIIALVGAEAAPRVRRTRWAGSTSSPPKWLSLVLYRDYVPDRLLMARRKGPVEMRTMTPALLD